MKIIIVGFIRSNKFTGEFSQVGPLDGNSEYLLISRNKNMNVYTSMLVDLT